MNLINERIIACDEHEVKQEYFLKMIELRLEEATEYYIKFLH